MSCVIGRPPLVSLHRQQHLSVVVISSPSVHRRSFTFMTTGFSDKLTASRLLLSKGATPHSLGNTAGVNKTTYCWEKKKISIERSCINDIEIDTIIEKGEPIKGVFASILFYSDSSVPAAYGSISVPRVSAIDFRAQTDVKGPSKSFPEHESRHISEHKNVASCARFSLMEDMLQSEVQRHPLSSLRCLSKTLCIRTLVYAFFG